MAKTTKEERSELSRALAKALAYKDCGQLGKSAEWAARLVQLLGAESVLRPEVASAARGLMVLS